MGRIAIGQEVTQMGGKVTIVELQSKIVEFQVTIVEFQVTIVEFQVTIVEFQVTIVEFQVMSRGAVNSKRRLLPIYCFKVPSDVCEISSDDDVLEVSQETQNLKRRKRIDTKNTRRTEYAQDHKIGFSLRQKKRMSEPL
ncbi:hypothetical protein M8J77_016758 [Diaphorina citri]|nr:hypothetical protein M8J77_016758 [Diaphorina citri]